MMIELAVTELWRVRMKIKVRGEVRSDVDG